MVDVNKRLDADSSTTVSVLCYNLLAQDLIHKNMYLYDSHEPDVLSWDYRKINLFADLGGSKADVRCTLFVCVCKCFIESLILLSQILCLQEVQQDHYETWV